MLQFALGTLTNMNALRHRHRHVQEKIAHVESLKKPTEFIMRLETSRKPSSCIFSPRWNEDPLWKIIWESIDLETVSRMFKSLLLRKHHAGWAVQHHCAGGCHCLCICGKQSFHAPEFQESLHESIHIHTQASSERTLTNNGRDN